MPDSPQAKGRVERLFRTFQDRLIKELRLAGVATLDVANRFMATYLPIYNQRFSVQPAQPADLHRPRPASRDLDRSLCLKTTRVLRRDWTVAHHGQLYQIRDNVRATHVQVEERIDGTMRMTHHGQPLRYHGITSRPVRREGTLATRGATASRQAEAHASVASPRFARPSQASGDPDDVNRTFLLWEEADISIWA